MKYVRIPEVFNNRCKRNEFAIINKLTEISVETMLKVDNIDESLNKPLQKTERKLKSNLHVLRLHKERRNPNCIEPKNVMLIISKKLDG